jgi:hypothetical protein
MRIRKPKKREVMLLGVLVLSIAYTAMLDSKAKRVKAANRKLREESRAAQQAATALPIAPAGKRANAAQKWVSGGWGMDPFNKPFTRFLDDHDPRGSAGNANETRDLELSGVITTPRGAAALINGVVCCEGDEVEGFIVERIEKGRVQLRRKNGNEKALLELH